MKKKDAQPKSPAVKKTKQVETVKIMAIQQHYKDSDFKTDENEDDDGDVPVIVDAEEEEK